MTQEKGGCPKEPRLWEEEFSISASEQSYVERRQLGRFLLLISGAMFTGQLWLVAKGLLSRTAEIVWPRKAIASPGEIAVGAAKVFQYPNAGDNCLLIRLSGDRYVAFSQKCTHLSCAVIFSEEQKRLECPCHQGYFSVEDGHVLQGPPPRPLERVVLEIAEGQIVATGMTVFGQEPES